MDANRFKWPVRPVALKENIVKGDKYRFTVLSPSLLRLEYDPEGVFEDRATQMAFYRDFPKNEFSCKTQNGNLVVETDNLILTYKENEPFSAETLNIKMKIEPAASWNFGEWFEELGGTVKTLDTVNGAMPLERGVCSRNGFSVVDDSDSLPLGDDGWIETRGSETDDFYFFGHGFDYLGAVKDLYRLTGAPSMLPAYALGNWWSRYHAYTEEEYVELMERFKSENIPFSVAVIDMDWHVVNIPAALQDKELPGGWTGYSWNKELFPDYKRFLNYLHKNNLHPTLNLHPADGIRRHEDMYEEMARACGIDPATGERVKLDILSKDFMAKYFDIVHHPYEDAGVDFWWMDWQQGTDYHWIHEANRDGKMADPREAVDPLWLLNHLHILDIGRDGKRPMFFSRFGGIGSHRYPVGFSGDTFCTWESLAFQPYFTSTASNTGYSWWSHDIGGHQRGYRDSDMLVRWMQYGVFSPINRIHSSNSPFQQKEPWFYESEIEGAMKDALRLRHKLFPYIYTMNYRNHNDLVPLITPMYYHYPKCSAAYEMKNQYFFGSELMVAAITEPRDQKSRRSAVEAWIPDGEWFDFFDGTRYSGCGGRKMRIFRTIDKYPVFARAGAIVPMANYSDNELKNAYDMEIAVFAGADNSFTLYEDALEGYAYKDGEFSKIQMDFCWSENCAEFIICRPDGNPINIPMNREYTISFRGFNPAREIRVEENGSEIEFSMVYDSKTHSVNVSFKAASLSNIKVAVIGESLMFNNNDVNDKILDICVRSEISQKEKAEIYDKAIITDKNLHRRIYDFTGNSIELQPTVDAIVEQLTLTEPEFTGQYFSC